MGGFFGTISRKNCVYDVFFGTDYHSHLGTRRAGLAFYDKEKGFQRQIHSIENTPFRTKFDSDVEKFSGNASCFGLERSIPLRKIYVIMIAKASHLCKPKIGY